MYYLEKDKICYDIPEGYIEIGRRNTHRILSDKNGHILIIGPKGGTIAKYLVDKDDNIILPKKLQNKKFKY